MKLYIFYDGKVVLPPDHYLGIRKGVGYSIPIPMYLVDSEKHGVILCDTGVNFDNAPPHMQKDLRTSPELRIDRQMATLGYKPEDVKHVIISHCHLDHAGQMMLFPHATFHIRKSEWDAALNHESGGYVPADYEGAQDFDFDFIPDDVDYDVFGDGSIICIDTKGHTRGHQSVVLNLEHTGTVVLAMDAAQLEEDLYEEYMLHNENYSGTCCLEAAAKLRAYKDKGALILFGHDPDQMKTLKLAPDYYD